MAFATTSDGIKLYYESAGSGSAIVFVHEFGGNHWSWEPQMNFFPRRHRCVTYAARGFPPTAHLPPRRCVRIGRNVATTPRTIRAATDTAWYSATRARFCQCR